MMQNLVKKMSSDLQVVSNIRALVPVLRNPLQVEVDGGPEDIGDPCAIVLLRLEKPLSIFDQDQCAEWGPIYHVCEFSFQNKPR